MTPADSPARSSPPQQGIALRRRARQLGWASVPILSLSLLAFVPFLWLALIRRRVRDWVVFAAYLAAVVAELILVSVGKKGSAASATGGAILVLVAVTATVHALMAYRPTAGVPSWRDVHAVRAADKRRQRAMAVAKEREIHEQAIGVRAAMADQKQAQKADRATAHAASAEAMQARKQEEAAQKAARQAQRQEERAASAEAKRARKQEAAEQKAARQAQQREELAAARAAQPAAPRYGWVETRRTYRRKTIFGNRRTETIVSRPSQRNARRRTRQRFGGVTNTEEWQRLE